MALTGRSFNSPAALVSDDNIIKTEYLVSSTKVLLRMPSVGQMWFFIKPETTVDEFKQAIKDEDTQEVKKSG